MNTVVVSKFGVTRLFLDYLSVIMINSHVFTAYPYSSRGFLVKTEFLPLRDVGTGEDLPRPKSAPSPP